MPVYSVCLKHEVVPDIKGYGMPHKFYVHIIANSLDEAIKKYVKYNLARNGFPIPHLAVGMVRGEYAYESASNMPEFFEINP